MLHLVHMSLMSLNLKQSLLLLFSFLKNEMSQLVGRMSDIGVCLVASSQCHLFLYPLKFL